MKEATQNQHFEWMKHRLKWYEIESMSIIPLLILLWYLDYKTGFWWLLGITILGGIAFCYKMQELSKKAGMGGDF